MVLDVFDLCTPELKEKLLPIRGKFKEMEDRKLEEAAKVRLKIVIKDSVTYYL